MAAANSQDLYQRSDAQLYSAFNYPTIPNEKAVELANSIDDCLYQAAEVVDSHCDYVRREYACIVISAIFKASRKSFSSVGDRYYYTTLPLVGTPGWLRHVREFVSPFRALLLNMLNNFAGVCDGTVLAPETAYEIERLRRLEKSLGCTPNCLYGVHAEVMEQQRNTTRIIRQMALPYLRRVVTVSKGYANEPEAFLDNYQNGVHGIVTAIGKYDVRSGAFAFFVDIWIKNKMIGGISSASNSIQLPERVWKHKRLINKHQSKSLEEIAVLENVSADLLQDSMRLMEMRNAAPLIEENDENADNLEAYHDRESEDAENRLVLDDQLRKYTRRLSAKDISVLSLAFDVTFFNDVDKNDEQKEAARQLYIAHARDH